MASRNATSDEDLVRQAIAGDQDAYTELYRRLVPRMRALAYRILPFFSDHDDLAHDATTHVLLQLAKFRGQCQFGTWAHRIGVNEALTVLRKRRARNEGFGGPLFSLDDTPENIDTPPTQVADPHDGHAAAEARLTAEWLMRRLPPVYREGLEARYLLEENCVEYAERTGKSIGAFKSTLSRGIHRARKVFDADAAPVVDGSYQLPFANKPETPIACM
jgi:RNA polymerase sigma-70 factor (ECF subfamily)